MEPWPSPEAFCCSETGLWVRCCRAGPADRAAVAAEAARWWASVAADPGRWAAAYRGGPEPLDRQLVATAEGVARAVLAAAGGPTEAAAAALARAWCDPPAATAALVARGPTAWTPETATAAATAAVRAAAGDPPRVTAAVSVPVLFDGANGGQVRRLVFERLADGPPAGGRVLFPDVAGPWLWAVDAAFRGSVSAAWAAAGGGFPAGAVVRWRVARADGGAYTAATPFEGASAGGAFAVGLAALAAGLRADDLDPGVAVAATVADGVLGPVDPAGLGRKRSAGRARGVSAVVVAADQYPGGDPDPVGGAVPAADLPAALEACRVRPPVPVTSLGRLPRPSDPALFVGRGEVIDRIDRCWRDRTATVMVLVASGGTGKSMVAWKWLERLRDADGWRFCPQALDWSFYSQGQHDYQTDSGKFLDEAVRHFGGLGEVDADRLRAAPPAAKAEAVAGAFVRTGGVLVLDGAEPLQHPEADGGGFRDRGLGRLVEQLVPVARLGPADRRRLLLITTRWPVGGLAAGPGVEVIPLGPLTEADGADLLRGVRLKDEPGRGLGCGDGDGPAADAAFRAAARAHGGHPLALLLLASSLLRYADGRLERWREVSDGADGDAAGPVRRAVRWLARRLGRPPRERADDPHRHARRVIRGYDRLLAADPALADARRVLFQLGLFDRPAPADLLAALRAGPGVPGLSDGLTDARFRAALRQLRDLRLVCDCPDGAAIDAHPLIREHFGRRLRRTRPRVWRAAHARLFGALDGPAVPLRPDEMEPLFQKVVHGCKAGRYRDALGVLVGRVLRGDEEYAALQLGAFPQLVSVLSHFVAPGGRFDPAPGSDLSADEFLAALGYAGKYLTPTKGYAAAETAACYASGMRWADRHRRPRAGFGFEFGYWRVLFSWGDNHGTAAFGDRLLARAEAVGDPELVLVAHRAVAAAAGVRGDFGRAAATAVYGRPVRDPAAAGRSARLYLNEPAVTCLGYGAISRWHLGDHPGAAADAAAAADRAARLGHPHTEAVTLYLACIYHQMRGDEGAALAAAAASHRIAEGQQYAFWQRAGTYAICGLSAAQAAVRAGDPAGVRAGIAQYHRGFERAVAAGTAVHNQFWTTCVADLLLREWDRAPADGLLDEAAGYLRGPRLEAVARGERWWEAEALRLEGGLYRRRAATAGPARPAAVREAEELFRQAIEVARGQRSVMLELRAAVSLGELLAGEGRPADARADLERAVGQLAPDLADPFLDRARQLLAGG